MYVSGSAGLKYLLRPMDRVDPTLCSLARELVQPRHVVWDVGANIGLFAFSAAHYAGVDGRVIAFEPDAWLVQLLRRSTGLQPPSSAPVQVVPVAVAASCDLRTFNLASRSRATNYLAGYGSTEAGSIREVQTVAAVSIDWLADRLPPPDVLKIDVEGAELEVLTGAARLLETRRPRIVCEVSAPRSPGVTALLHGYGYRLYDGEVPSAHRKPLPEAPWNTVAIAD